MFSSDWRGLRDIYKRLASGEVTEEIVFASEMNKSVNSWSRDGRLVVYDTGALRGNADLYGLPLIGDRRPVVLASEPGFQQQADISPDGRLLRTRHQSRGSSK